VLVIDDEASGGSIEVHMTDQRPGAQLFHRGVKTPDAVAVRKLNHGPHGVSLPVSGVEALEAARPLL
jgi:hypothetical protein